MTAKLPTWKSALGAVAVSGVALLAAAPPALAQDGGGGPDPTHASAQERASAQVLPSVDQIQMTVSEAYLINPSTGDSYHVTGTMGGTCTGFTLSGDGYIGTAGHCVDPAILGDQARVIVAKQAAAEGYDADATYQNLQSWVIAGDASGQSKLNIKVTALPATAKPGDKPMDATIVDMQPFTKGDTALLKVNGTNMMTVPMGPNEPAPVGTPVMAIGYPGIRQDEGMDATLTPSYQAGSVSSQQSKDGIAYTEISANVGHGMSGGPTINEQGQVIGINSQMTADGTDKFNFVVPVARMNEMVNRAGAHASAGPVDTAYRAGLQDYFAGHYSDAADEFDQTLAVSPGNKAAQDFKDKAIRAHDQFGDKGLNIPMWGWIAGGVALLAVVGGVIMGLLRRKGRGQAPAPAAGAPTPVGPAPQGWAAPGAPQQGPPQGTPSRPQYGPAPVGAARPFGPTAGHPAPAVPQQRTPHRVEQPEESPEVRTRLVETGPPSPPVGFPSPLVTAPATVPATSTEPASAETDSTKATTVVTTGRTATALAPAPAPASPVGNGFCGHCGAGSPAGARFCRTCGSAMR